MQEQITTLEKQLKPVIEKSLEIASNTGSFVIEQAPLVLQEFYIWNTSRLIFFLGLFAMALIILVSLAILWYRRGNDDGYTAGWVISSILALVCIGNLVYNGYMLIFIHVAPRLYIIEYFLDRTQH